jgi:hypothetical protein
MTTRRSNAWQLHVKKYAHEHGISYRDAMRNSECKSSYHSSKVKAEPAEHTVQFHTAENPPSKVEKPTKRLTKKRMKEDLEQLETQLASLKKNSKKYKTLMEQSQSLRLRLASKPARKAKQEPEPEPEPNPEPEPTEV